MEEVSLTDTETRYYADLFVCCDVDKTGKIPMLKATELYRSANINEDVVVEITSLSGIPATALHISRAQFYSCLKLIAAYQSGKPLRQELIAATLQLPLPRFSWKESPSALENASSHIHSNGLNNLPASAAAEWSESGSRRNSAVQQQSQEAAINSDVLSTDSEVEQNESSCGGTASAGAGGAGGAGTSSRETRRRGSPEAWSTNSDSPTPTNSVAERPWAKDTLWHGLLGDEHRQLLGTEEESSDRHSSDDDNETDLETVYQITPEQREYYFKQFKAVQRDTNGLLSGQVARVFFEKSRIPVEELRHIWQLCDVTRDGALSLAEFTAAMHLVVLRRNNIPLPTVLPACLHPSGLQHASQQQVGPQEPPEADLLHLNDDDEEDNTDNTIVAGGGTGNNNVTRNVGATEKNVMSMSNISTSSQASNNSRQGQSHTTLTPPPIPPHNNNNNKQRSISNSPNNEPSVSSPSNNLAKVAAAANNSTTSTVVSKTKDRSLWTTDAPSSQWTKFTESPTSNVSSPGPKPVNFDMQRTAQAVVSDPQILHPVPLRVTPVAGAIVSSSADVPNTEAATAHELGSTSTVVVRDASPKTHLANTNSSLIVANQSSTSNTSAIQRPQAKKLPSKNSVLPPPPQRESSIGSVGSGAVGAGDAIVDLPNGKKDPPPPPPRPHRHGRSSSLDLNKFKMSAPNGQPENSISCEQQHSLANAQAMVSSVTAVAALPPSRISLQSSQNQQRVSAFEVYRKPNTPRNSQSPNATPTALIQQHSVDEYHPQPTQPPPPAPFGSGVVVAPLPPPLPNADLYEKRVNAISETLRHVSFRQDSNNTSSMPDVLRHLREQNNLLLRLCNDLSDELLTVQTRKEEMRLKLELNTHTSQMELSTGNCATLNAASVTTARTGSSISAPVTASITGGSGSSGVHSNV